jgi:hypothetical protein
VFDSFASSSRVAQSWNAASRGDASRPGNKKVFVERSRYRGNVTSAVKSGAVETPVL